MGASAELTAAAIHATASELGPVRGAEMKNTRLFCKV